MRINIDKEIVRRSIKYYGHNLQAVVAMEECGELVQAIGKHLRGEAEDESHITEEIADVLIGIENLKYIFGITDSDINSWIAYKQDRLSERMRCKNER